MRRLVNALSSTSNRSFVLWPGLVLAEGLASGRPIRWRFAPLALAGYLLYRLGGSYRTRRGGGGPGMSRPPERLVTTGVYGVSRNPMYLGHLVTMTGLVAMTRSPAAVLLLAGHLPWFNRRAARDERRLAELFGEEYTAYRDAVPRWLGRRRPRPGASAEPTAEAAQPRG